MKKPHIIVSGQAGHGKDSVGSYLVESHGYMRTAFGDPLKEEVFSIYEKSSEKVHWDTVNSREMKEVPLERLALKNCSSISFQKLSLAIFSSEDDRILPYMKLAIEILEEKNKKNLSLMGRSANEFLGLEKLDENDRMALPRSFRRICQIWGTEHRRGAAENKNYWVDKIQEKIDASDCPVVITDGRFDNECEWAQESGIRRINVMRPLWAMSAQSEEAKKQSLAHILDNRNINWKNAPGIETLMKLVYAKIAVNANSQVKHSSEEIPEVDDRTADLVNDGSLSQLHEKTEEALKRFMREARPRLAI